MAMLHCTWDEIVVYRQFRPDFEEYFKLGVLLFKTIHELSSYSIKVHTFNIFRTYFVKFKYLTISEWIVWIYMVFV